MGGQHRRTSGEMNGATHAKKDKGGKQIRATDGRGKREPH